MASRNTYPWKRIVDDAKRHTGWILPPELVGVPVRVAQGIRLCRHPDLICADGLLEVQVVDVWTDEFGRKRANLFVRFKYHEEV